MVFDARTFFSSLVQDQKFQVDSVAAIDSYSGGYARLRLSATDQAELVTTAADTVQQVLCSFKCDDGSIAAGTEVARIATNRPSSVRIISQGALGFTIDLWTNVKVATGLTVYSWNTDYYLLWYADHGTYSRVAIGATLATLYREIDYAGSCRIDGATRFGVYSQAASASATYFWFKRLVMAGGADTTELGDPTGMTSGLKTPTSGTPLTGWDQFTGVTPPATNKWDDVDDWATGAADDDTTSNSDAGVAGTTYQQLYKTAALTMANITTIFIGLKIKTSVNNKTNTARLSYSDGSVASSGSAVNLGGTTWTYLRAQDVSTTAGGNAWTQTELNNLQIGVKCVVGTQADIDALTAIEAEALYVPLLAAEPIAALVILSNNQIIMAS